ncbi:dissimilatory sulfite reductase (desulfoviridin), gamma subunit [Thioflavicoccus mobilis 8321]|uniref:Dissimilatory sulfite reductase (Desulfoviridin), gamma subunit n=1 Tax=Thioflavicoccus mobilis 8321 TaxID=765912 RepID=L0GYQ0_9GAMM|nr:TusE/DsrC/DsvC family sulfur relay protein [Thioflavicoccus mobilis]AGA91081.1 dissimilatory sulfite reductase (desulfoviridin), gamma subunit [Thioflavicoccus mobilis 8321]
MNNPSPHPDTAKPLRLLPLDADGFVIDPLLWSPGMSRAIARRDNMRLTPEHWWIIHSMREHYLASGAIPPASHICRSQGLDRYAVRRLFGSCREAWRVAGLPNPGTEVLNYMN